MRIYETMFIVNPELDDSVREEIANRVKTWIEEKAKGTIRKFDRWGMRQLAFRVDKFYQGDYTVVLFDTEPSNLKALEEMYRITPEIFKWMIFRRKDMEKHPPEIENEKKEPEKSTPEVETVAVESSENSVQESSVESEETKDISEGEDG